MKYAELEALRSHWTAENILECGKPLFEAVPAGHVPNWAGTVLSLVAEGRFMCGALERLIFLSQSNNAEDWAEARTVFSNLRTMTRSNYQNDRASSLEQMILEIGETTAKVIYNASGSSAPYDHHAGWRMAPHAKRAIDKIGDAHLEQACWALLTRQMNA